MQEIPDGLGCCAPRLPAELASLKLAVCATPSIEGFDRVLLTPGRAAGDLTRAALPRILDLLCATPRLLRARRPSPRSRAVPGAAAPAASRRRDVRIRRSSDCRRAARAGGVPVRDKVMLLLVAALSSPARRRGGQRTLACCSSSSAASTLGALHAAALSALLGYSASKRTPATCWSCCAGVAAATRSSVCTPRRPPACCTPCIDPASPAVSAAVAAWCRSAAEVCEVRPPRACPGEEILIVGCGFGHRAGQSRSAVTAHSGAPGGSSAPGATIASRSSSRRRRMRPQHRPAATDGGALRTLPRAAPTGCSRTASRHVARDPALRHPRPRPRDPAAAGEPLASAGTPAPPPCPRRAD